MSAKPTAGPWTMGLMIILGSDPEQPDWLALMVIGLVAAGALGILIGSALVRWRLV